VSIDGHALAGRIRRSAVGALLMAATVAISLLVALALMAAYGVSPGEGISAFAQGAFGTDVNFAATVAKAIPLSFVALAVIVTTRAGKFQIGFPGQIMIAGIFCSIVALKLSLPAVIHLPLTVLAAMVGGALWAGIAAWLWAKRGVNEILSTLLLNLVAAQVLIWWVRNPFHDDSTPLPQTLPFPSSARFPSAVEGTELHWDLLLVPVAVAAVAYLLARTTWGFRLRVTGANEQVANFSGISAKRASTEAIVASGAIAGLAGSSLVLAATIPTMTEEFEDGYGFLGIAVALLARNSPWAVIPAALLFGALLQAGQSMEATIGISASLVGIVEGIMIMLVLVVTTILFYRRSRRAPGGPASAEGTIGTVTEAPVVR
jgi:simple sugar transport system permease protein